MISPISIRPDASRYRYSYGNVFTESSLVVGVVKIVVTNIISTINGKIMIMNGVTYGPIPILDFENSTYSRGL